MSFAFVLVIRFSEYGSRDQVCIIWGILPMTHSALQVNFDFMSKIKAEYLHLFSIKLEVMVKLLISQNAEQVIGNSSYTMQVFDMDLFESNKGCGK